MAAFLEYISEVKKNGSPVAFQKLLETFDRQVFTMCFRILGNREEAEEAAQDVFLTCYRKLNTLKEPEKFPQWLLKIAYSKSIDYVRRKKVAKVHLEDAAEIPGDINAHTIKGNLSDSDILEAAINSLDPDNGAIINLYYQENLSIKEIAQFMQLSDSNVKVRLHRSRAHIRAFLESRGPIKKNSSKPLT